LIVFEVVVLDYAINMGDVFLEIGDVERDFLELLVDSSLFEELEEVFEERALWGIVCWFDEEQDGILVGIIGGLHLLLEVVVIILTEEEDPVIDLEATEVEILFGIDEVDWVEALFFFIIDGPWKRMSSSVILVLGPFLSALGTEEESGDHEVVLAAHLHPVESKRVDELLGHGIDYIVVEEVELESALTGVVWHDVTHFIGNRVGSKPILRDVYGIYSNKLHLLVEVELELGEL
jgi:hypothetical protein